MRPYQSTTLQILALATVVLTQTLGVCYCAAMEEICRPFACATESSPAESGCCPDQPESEGSPSCCLDLQLGWDLPATVSGILVPEPAVARLDGFGPALHPCLPSGSESSLGFALGSDPRPPGGPLRALYCVRLI